VSGSSVYTTNSSLPGFNSHRNRRLLLKLRSAELYCTSALANMRGENA
jgi:hypothetical protein